MVLERMALWPRIAVFDRCGHELQEFRDDAAGKLRLGEAVAVRRQGEPAGEPAPIWWERSAGVAVTSREVRFEQRLSRTFVAQQMAEIGEWRTGEGVFPIQDGGDSPGSLPAMDQQVAPSEVAMHQMSGAGERSQGVGLRPEQRLNSVAEAAGIRACRSGDARHCSMKAGREAV